MIQFLARSANRQKSVAKKNCKKILTILLLLLADKHTLFNIVNDGTVFVYWVRISLKYFEYVDVVVAVVVDVVVVVEKYRFWE